MAWLEQSFFFDWLDPAHPIPIPITTQCETINIKWGRGDATGPDPVAPYKLAVYTNNFITPFTIDAGSGFTKALQIPFAPNTQYQICMFDSKGNTGGCQDLYTIYPSTPTPTCNNLTFPDRAMNVQTSFGQNAWIESCSDLVITPQEGKAPFTLTVAPTLRPPQIITGIGMEGIRWKLTLDSGAPFFVSLADSSGLTWSYGPLHAAKSDISCLLKSKGLSIGTAAGAAFAALLVGAVMTYIVMFFLTRRKDRQQYGSEKITSGTTAHPFPLANLGAYDPYRPLPSSGRMSSSPQPEDNDYDDRYTSLGGSGRGRSMHTDLPQIRVPNSGQSVDGLSSYEVERFEPHHGSHGSRGSSMGDFNSSAVQRSSRGPTSPTMTHHTDHLSSPGGRAGSMFVVHHDGGAAPVTLYSGDGTLIPVQELPPSYIGDGSHDGHSNVGGSRPRENDGRPTGAAPPDPRLFTGAGRQLGNDNLADRKRAR